MTPAEALRAASLRIGSTVDGKYKITSVIGLGGMGVVYEAKHLYLGRAVALKVLHPRLEDAHDASLRFLREARTSGSVQHRTLVDVMDAGFLDGTTPYIVMERLLGESLRARILRRKALRVSQAGIILREVLKGLAAAHAKSVVHCDLKPENVFLVDRHIEFGTVKVLDFGVARLVGVDSRQPGEPRVRAGTPNYMAPEQVQGGELDPRADLYSLGAVIYEALAGRPPFELEPRATVFERVLKARVPPLVGLREPVPAELGGFIAQLLARPRDARPASALEALRAMDDVGLAPAPISLGHQRAAKPKS